MVKRWLILVTLGLFFFMVIIDGTIVVVAVPTIASALAVNPSQVNLLLTVYLTTISVCLLFFGQVADRYGRMRLFIWGTCLFLIGSGLAGLGIDFQLVLMARILQAVGASMTMATSYAIIADVFPPRILGRALGVESIFISAGALAGPGIGGLILSHLPWGYIFWVNLPIGAVCLLIEFVYFSRSHEGYGKEKVDVYGFFQLVIVGGLLLLFQMNKQPLLAGILVVLISSLIYYFWYHERQTEYAMLDIHLFSYRFFSRNLIGSFLNYVAAYFFTLLAPIYLQLVLHLPVALSGYLLMITPIVSLVANPVAGVLSDKFDRYRLMRIGLLLLILTNTIFALTPNKATFWLFVVVSVGFAVGTALFTNPNSVVLIQSVDVKMRGQVGAATSLARQLGMSVGSIFAGLVFYQTLGIASPHTTAASATSQTLLVAHRVSFTLAAVIFFIAAMILRKKVENATRT